MNKVLLDKIDELQASIDKHGVLEAELQKKINYRFRLDWNFYSNEMEGNSLTRIETRQLMMENVTVDGKPFKDVFEMQGHDKEVLEIMRIGKGEVRLSESRIKAMHRAIMYESDPEKEQLIGNWKPYNNYLTNYKGERFDFVPFSEVADAMHHLLNQTNAGIDALKAAKKETIHPVELAFQFHLEYIRIHPFYDGNGRTARLLTNLLLISAGFPPVILRKKDRDLYYKYLADIQGYGAHPDLFLDFMGELVVQSQQLILDAINGKSLEDEDDLDKEIALWKNELDHEREVIKLNNEVIVNIYENSLKPLFLSFIEKHKPFEDVFEKTEISSSLNNKDGVIASDFHYFEDYIEEIKSIIKKDNPILPTESIKIDRLYNMTLEIRLRAFIKAALNTFNEKSGLRIQFTEYNYTIASNNFRTGIFVKKLYSEQLSKEEIKYIVTSIVKQTFDNIKQNVNRKV